MSVDDERTKRIDLDARLRAALSRRVSRLRPALHAPADASALHYAARRLAVCRRPGDRSLRRHQRHLTADHRLLGRSLERDRRDDLGVALANAEHLALFRAVRRRGDARQRPARHRLVRHEYRRLHAAGDQRARGPARRSLGILRRHAVERDDYFSRRRAVDHRCAIRRLRRDVFLRHVAGAARRRRGHCLSRALPHAPRKSPTDSSEPWWREIFNVFDRHILSPRRCLFTLHFSLPCFSSFVVLYARELGVEHFAWYFVAIGITSCWRGRSWAGSRTRSAQAVR